MAVTGNVACDAASSRAGSQAQYDVVAERDVLVAMRDGVRLATDLYLPSIGAVRCDGQYPVVVERTPYDKHDPDLIATAKRFARHGYVVALQDVRGRFASEGEWLPFTEEAEDGYDTVEWLAGQPWCNGHVGTMGLSYAGSNQHALATLNPPHLSAMFVAEAMSSYHECAMRQGGAMELRFLIYAFIMAWDSPEAQSSSELRAAVEEQMEQLHDLLENLPFKPGTTVLRHFPTIERWVYDVLIHGVYDAYWQQRGYNVKERYEEHADVPMYHLSGWYDTYPRATTDNYVAFTKRKRSQQRLIIGPWVHDIQELTHTYSGDADFGLDAPLDYDALRLRFFDETLKGLDTGLDDEPPVRIFVMGGGSGRKLLSGRIDHGGVWREEATWPLGDCEERSLYLHGDGSLDEHAPARGPGESGFRFDPADPVPTVGGSISAADIVLPPGGFDQRHRPGLWGCRHDLPLNVRQDVITFQTQPLSEEMEVTGTCVVDLWVASTAVDTDFTAKLLDVYPASPDFPDGYALNLQDSIIRMRFREGPEREVPMERSEVYGVQIMLYPISNVFACGHRLRLDISSSNFPRFDVNPNTGAALGTPGRYVVADNTLFHDASHPSAIRLPVVERVIP